MGKDKSACVGCPGRGSGQDSAREGKSTESDIDSLRVSVPDIGKRLLVISGKGGVGKSTVAVNLALALALAGRKTGLLDVDIHGPNVPRMLNLDGTKIEVNDGMLVPAGFQNLKVMSLAFMLSSQQDAVIWRGPLKMNVIRQFIRDVDWGELDVLVVDCPPGTGDEPLSVAQLLAPVDGAIVVTTPQGLSQLDAQKAVTFCRQLTVPVIGVLENMSGLVCPHCGKTVELFRSGGGEQMSAEMDVPFLGSVPLDPQVCEGGDSGKPFVYFRHDAEVTKAFLKAIKPVIESFAEPAEPESGKETSDVAASGTIKYALPLAEGKVCLHFGHCQEFAIIVVGQEGGEILSKELLEPPAHEPGALPRWLTEHQVQRVIAGGMGARAQQLLSQNGIEVIVGAPSLEPEELVRKHLEGSLECGDNVCDH